MTHLHRIYASALLSKRKSAIATVSLTFFNFPRVPNGSLINRYSGMRGVNVNAFTSGLTSINIGGFSGPVVGFSASLPWVRAETNINFVNQWTKIIHNHTIKVGADMSDVALPGSHYTHRVVAVAVRLVVEDGLPYRAAAWHLWRDHRVFVPFATIQNWVEASGKKSGRADDRRVPGVGLGGLLRLHRR